MAWGTLKEVGWVNAFTSGMYATDNYVKYQIDESSRKLRVIVTRQRVRSLGSAYSYSGNVNNGCQFLGGGKDSQYSGGYDTEDTISVSGGGSTLIPSNSDRTIGAVYTYNNDGSVPSITLSTQMIFDLSGYDKTTYKFSNQDWKSQELKSKFPTIAKKAPNPVKDIIVTGVTTSTISISFTASSDASSYLVDWGTVNSTDETPEDMLAVGSATITDTTYTITDLKRNQLYLIMVTSLGSDGTGDDNSREIGYGKTLNVDPVTNVSVTEVSANSITVNFNLSQYAIKYSIVAIAIDDSGTASQAYSTTSTGTPATITGLSPNTKYKVGVSAIGTNNDMSDYVYVDNVTTLSQAQLFINVGGSAKRFLPQTIYINTSGHTSNTNLVYNGNAELGEDGWIKQQPLSQLSDDVPTGLDGVKHSFASRYIMKDKIKVYPDKYYYLSVWLKHTGTKKHYFCIVPFDVDGKEIEYHNFANYANAKLVKDLNPGDTVVYMDDISGWDTNANNYPLVLAIYGYTNGQGYTYPDYTYTQNAIQFANYGDDLSKVIDKTNNTVTLKSPYTGKTVPKGTAVSQNNFGNSFMYSFIQNEKKEEWEHFEHRGLFSDFTHSYEKIAQYIDKIQFLTGINNDVNYKTADIKFYESYEEIFGDTVKEISSLDVNVNGVAKKVF